MNPTALLAALLLAACAHTGTTPAGRIQVYKSDGARQCEGGGISPETMRQELRGIRVYAAAKQHLQGMMFPAVCGGATGSINVYTIDAANREKAHERGFQALPQNRSPFSDRL